MTQLEQQGIKIDGVHLSDLRFADDVVLATSNLKDLVEYAEKLVQTGLVVNTHKPRLLLNARNELVIIAGERI